LAIAVGGGVAGTLDLLQACILFGWNIPLAIAAGLLGRQAFHGGIATYILGVLLHFFIAFSFAAFYYAASRGLGFLAEHPLVCGLFYGAGIETVMNAHTLYPDVNFLMLTVFDDNKHIYDAICAGASGYLLKSAPLDELVGVIRKVHAGRKHLPAVVAESLAVYVGGDALTEREVEVLQQIAGGNRNQDIAQRLFISEETVKVHVKHIMEKLGARDRTQAVAIGIRRGIIQL